MEEWVNKTIKLYSFQKKSINIKEHAKGKKNVNWVKQNKIWTTLAKCSVVAIDSSWAAKILRWK